MIDYFRILSLSERKRCLSLFPTVTAQHTTFSFRTDFARDQRSKSLTCHDGEYIGEGVLQRMSVHTRDSCRDQIILKKIKGSRSDSRNIKDQRSVSRKIKDQLTDGCGPLMVNLVDVLVDARMVECTIRNRRPKSKLQRSKINSPMRVVESCLLYQDNSKELDCKGDDVV